ncbi:hypothetical protein YC2023_043934 [Brassica napus]
MEIRLREKEIYHQTVLAKDVSSSDTPIYTTLLSFEQPSRKVDNFLVSEVNNSPTRHVKDQVLMMMILDQNLGIHNSVETSSTARWVYHIYIMLLEFYHDVKVDKFHCDVRLTKYCQMLIGRLKPWKPPQKKQNERYIFFVVYAYNR